MLSQSQNNKYLHLNEVFKITKLIKAQSNIVVSSGCDEGQMKSCYSFKLCKMSSLQRSAKTLCLQLTILLCLLTILYFIFKSLLRLQCSVMFYCGPKDCSPPGFSGHAIFQARILEYDATSYSRGSSRPVDGICALPQLHGPADPFPLSHLGNPRLQISC